MLAKRKNYKPEQRLWHILDRLTALRTMTEISKELDKQKCSWPVMKEHPLVLDILQSWWRLYCCPQFSFGSVYANLGHTQVFQTDQASERLKFNLDLSSTISCPLKSVELQQAQLPFFQDVVDKRSFTSCMVDKRNHLLYVYISMTMWSSITLCNFFYDLIKTKKG